MAKAYWKVKGGKPQAEYERERRLRAMPQEELERLEAKLAKRLQKIREEMIRRRGL